MVRAQEAPALAALLDAYARSAVAAHVKKGALPVVVIQGDDDRFIPDVDGEKITRFGETRSVANAKPQASEYRSRSDPAACARI